MSFHFGEFVKYKTKGKQAKKQLENKIWQKYDYFINNDAKS